MDGLENSYNFSVCILLEWVEYNVQHIRLDTTLLYRNRIRGAWIYDIKKSCCEKIRGKLALKGLAKMCMKL